MLIESWTHGLPWARAFVRQARALGAHPLVHYEDEEAFWEAIDKGQTRLVGSPGAHEWGALAKTDAFVFLWGPEDLPRLDRLPEKVRQQATAYNLDWYRRGKKAGLRGIRIEMTRATRPFAQRYDVNYDELQQELLRASLAKPDQLHRSGERLRRALRRGRSLRIRHENGSDLALRLRGVEPRVQTGVPNPASGRPPFNILTSVPSGSVRTALDEGIATGELIANRPSYWDPVVLKGGRWTFDSGHLRESTFFEGGVQFEERLKKAKTQGSKPGFLSIGLNPEIRTAPQQEDLELGTVCVGVGQNRFVNGRNDVSFFAWLAIGGATVDVDGKVLVESGQLK